MCFVMVPLPVVCVGLCCSVGGRGRRRTAAASSSKCSKYGTQRGQAKCTSLLLLQPVTDITHVTSRAERWTFTLITRTTASDLPHAAGVSIVITHAFRSLRSASAVPLTPPPYPVHAHRRAFLPCSMRACRAASPHQPGARVRVRKGTPAAIHRRRAECIEWIEWSAPH